MTAAIPLVFSEEVREALHDQRPVVALESNVITHGLKYPDNAATAHQVETAVRKGGSVPATICISGGAIRVGMTERDIERFACEQGIPKVSSRDLPVVLARGGLGATTVASSLVAAGLAGIPFFASAGLGGVHRGAETSMDISSDLIQLTRSKVAVVCAGGEDDPRPEAHHGVPGDAVRPGDLPPVRRLPRLLLRLQRYQVPPSHR